MQNGEVRVEVAGGEGTRRAGLTDSGPWSVSGPENVSDKRSNRMCRYGTGESDIV